MACAAIARRGVPTLILVHRKPLMEQWSSRLQRFLGLSTKDIRIIGKARYRDAPVAIGMFQTLASAEFPGLLMEKYGQVVVDECHHVPAASFEAAMKQCPARHILGLTATPTRKDGLQKILYLQCGPIQHKIGYDHANKHPRSVMVRNIPACFPADAERQPIHEVWKFLIESEERNRLIASDIVSAFRHGRYPVVLSDRKEHLNRLETMVRETLPEDAICRMDGSIGLKQRRSLIQCLTERTSSGTPFVLFATASLIGEGFDLPRLDTMVLAMPLSFKGRLTQYAGRLHRSADGKGDVRIHDYVETNHPMMMHMHRKRMVA
jgi:superfamily II DNA or RNA helicase